MTDSTAGWNILAQQVQMARVDFTPGPELSIDMDRWSGYEFERRSLIRRCRDRKIANPVILSGDIHSNWANELAPDFDHPDAPNVAVELIGTSITSNGDGAEKHAYAETLLSENLFVKFHNTERGYVRCEVTPTGWRADYRTVPYVSRRDAPLNTRASFLIESGRSKLQRV